MNKFVFRLEPLFEYRQRLEELCKKELGVALRRLEEEETKLGILKEAYRRSSEEADCMKERGGDVQDLSLYYAYFTGLKLHIEEQEKIIRKVREDFEAKRGELLDASKRKKVVEKIKERSYGSYIENMNRMEQKVSDDIVTCRFKRSGGR